MQLWLPLAAALVQDTRDDARLRGRGTSASDSSHHGGAAAGADASADLAVSVDMVMTAEQSCQDKAHRLLFLDDHPEARTTVVSRTPERALDYCGLKPEADKKYMCKYFKQFVKDALVDEKQDAKVTTKSFCKLTEAHAGQVEAQVQMFGVLSHYWGMNDTAKKEPFHGACVADVNKAIQPEAQVAKDKAADDLYLFCMNYQECSHHTMAHDQDCRVSYRNPATGKHLCELLRTDVVKLTVEQPQDSYEPEQVCDWLVGFTHRQAMQNEAYRYVMHGEETSPSLIPTVSPADEALLLSSLANGARAHWIRDHAAHNVRRASAALAAALFGLLM